MSAAAAFVSTISCIGVSHRGAPLEVLERLAIPTDALPRALRHFSARGPSGERLREGVILSTCNRTEIYTAGRPVQPADGMPELLSVLPAGLVDVLSESSGLSRADLAGRMIRYDGWAAAEHLFRVVCGLDSLVVGESQVAGQVARAYAAAQRAGTAGVVLSTLFQSAIGGGRHARARIGIGRSASNAGSAALDLAESAGGPLAGSRAVVIGTGEIGRIVVHELRKRRVSHIDIVSRTAERAAAVAERWGCSGYPMSHLPGLVAGCDILVSTAGAAERPVTAELVRTAVDGRAGRALVLIDLAVPRTIAPESAALPGVRLFDIDSLKTGQQGRPPAIPGSADFAVHGDSRPPAIPGSADFAVPGYTRPRSPEEARVEQMIGEDLAELVLRMKELAVRPVIGDLWRKAAAIRESVLERARGRLSSLDDESWAEVEDLAASIVARLLHDPSTRLRAEASNGHAEAFSEALRELFHI